MFKRKILTLAFLVFSFSSTSFAGTNKSGIFMWSGSLHELINYALEFVGIVNAEVANEWSNYVDWNFQSSSESYLHGMWDPALQPSENAALIEAWLIAAPSEMAAHTAEDLTSKFHFMQYWFDDLICIVPEAIYHLFPEWVWSQAIGVMHEHYYDVVGSSINVLERYKKTQENQK